MAFTFTSCKVRFTTDPVSKLNSRYKF